MTDIETLIERDLERASRYVAGVNSNRWVLALLAYRIVGRRIEGLTLEFARRLGLTAPDAIEHWAKARRMYKILRRVVGKYEANVMRREFTVSHFYIMFDLGHKYHLSVREIAVYFRLLMMYKYDDASWSVSAMRAEVEADHPSKNAVDWHWHFRRTRKEAQQLLSFPELPQPVRRLATLWLKFMERY